MGVARRFASGQWCEAPSKPPLRAIELQSLAGGSSINARYATSIRPPPEVWLMVSTTVALTCARLQCGSRGHMSKSRRQFLARTSLGLLGAAAAGPGSAEPRRTSAWRAARFWRCSSGRTRGFAFHLRRSGEAHAGGSERHRARRCSRQLANYHGSALRATNRAAQGRVRTGTRTLVALGPGSARPKASLCSRPICPDPERFGAITCNRWRPRLRPADAALTLDRATKAYLGAAHPSLLEPA